MDDLDTIQLSKNFGLLSFPTTEGSYDLLGIEGRDLGEILPGIREFYDFEVGDVFQFRIESFGYSSSETIRKIEILSREDQDSSIVYFTNQVSRRTFREPMAPPDTSFSNIDLEWIIDLSFGSNLNFLNNSYPHQLYNLTEDWPPMCVSLTDSIYTPFRIEKDQNTGRIIKSTINNTDNSYDHIFYFINNFSDILTNGNCIGYTISEHITGLGEVIRDSEILDNGVISQLIGYVKDGDTTGIITPDFVILAVEKELPEAVIAEINPNLSNGFFQLKTSEGYTLRFSIYNIQGQLIQKMTDRLSGEDLDFDLSNEPNGIYFVRVWLDEEFRNIKIVKR